MFDEILAYLDSQKQTVIDVQRKLVGIPAIGPDNGGSGEREKAEYLKEYLASIGLSDIKELNAPDPRVPCGYRPNLAVVIPGLDSSRTFWSVAHMDVVPPGDVSLWNTNPFELSVEGDVLRGRGVEDDHHGVVCSLLLAKAFVAQKITPPINYGLLFVSDEETNNQYGVNFAIQNHKALFGPQDMFLVPDYGDISSEIIDVAEKSVLWAKIIVQGKQAHASRPHEGLNSLTASAALIMKLRELYKRFDKTSDIFVPPQSTFEATKKEANVGSINILPGRDVFYMDCRVLPEYDLEEVIKEIRALGKDISDEYGVELACEIVQRTQAAPPTSADSDILKRLVPAIRSVYGRTPRPIGVSCFTAAFGIRHAGFPAAVWATFNESTHKPDEYSSIALTINDAKVMAHVLFG
jgi:succinyl-diaminopimelate desuccinylase